MWQQQAYRTGARFTAASASIRKLYTFATTSSPSPLLSTHSRRAPTAVGAVAAAAAASLAILGYGAFAPAPAEAEAQQALAPAEAEAEQAPAPTEAAAEQAPAAAEAEAQQAAVPVRPQQHQLLGRYTVSDAAAKCAQSVVNISFGGTSTSAFFTPSSTVQSGCSGFILTADGVIVTTAQVAAAKGPLTVTLATGAKYAAKVTARDRRCNLALLKIDAPHPLPPATLGTSSALRPGEYVVALGIPRLVQNSLTLGIVSTVARPSADLGLLSGGNFIQTDAAINMGHMGGPLISLDGVVVGITSYKLANSGGISWAIPIDTAKQVLSQLQSKGRFTRPYLGLCMANVDRATYDPEFAQEQRAAKDKKAGDPAATGAVLVVAVAPGSPAERAGLQARDIILDLDAKPAVAVLDVEHAVGLEVGRSVAVTVKRGGETVALAVVTEAERVNGRGMFTVGAVTRVHSR